MSKFYGNNDITPSSEQDIEEESESADSLDDVIEINVFYNGKNLKIAYNKENQFKEFYEQLKEILDNKISLENYDIIYKLNIISPNEDRPISDIILEDDNQPSFILKKKNNLIKPPSYRDTTVLISYFPSFMDLAEQMNNFFDSQKEETDFTVNYKDNCCSIIFRDPEKAFTFITFLTQLKFSNKIYKKMKIDIKYKIKYSNKDKKYNLNHSTMISNRRNNYNKRISPLKKISKLSFNNLNFIGLKKYINTESQNELNNSLKNLNLEVSRTNDNHITNNSRNKLYSNYMNNNKIKRNIFNETSASTKKKRFYLLSGGQIVN